MVISRFPGHPIRVRQEFFLSPDPIQSLQAAFAKLSEKGVAYHTAIAERAKDLVPKILSSGGIAILPEFLIGEAPGIVARPYDDGISTYVIEGVCLDPEYDAAFRSIMDNCIHSISIDSEDNKDKDNDSEDSDSEDSDSEDSE